MRLLETFNAAENLGLVSNKLDTDITSNLAFTLRPYQVSAISRLDYYFNGYKNKLNPTHLFFHMATGSGKTLIMAANIIQLYKKGYRNFIFTSNLRNIILKTKANFLDENTTNSKALFKKNININGNNVDVKEVSDFKNASQESININFLSIQSLHSKIINPTENDISEDDFIDQKVAIFWDESHHGNVSTKNANQSDLISDNWELTVMRILNANSNNVLLEFTATMDLDNKAIDKKYYNKHIFDYPLKQFRLDKYSKEIKTLQTSSDNFKKILIAIIISQFKKKVFAKNNIICKPVILAKSKLKAESLLNRENFEYNLNHLQEIDLKNLISDDSIILNNAFNFFKRNNISLPQIINEIRSDFNDSKIISIDTDNDNLNNEILINTLEQNDNPIRLIFAVDKLNEGWDVLNLFDIVRLYDTRDAKNHKPGKTTISEAQLIGRGARYYPFAYNDEDKFKRKFDNDLLNDLRICETLHYHCSHNPRYIDELTVALKNIGIIEENRTEIQLKLKDSFKNSSFYKNGYLFINKKISSSDSDFRYNPEFKKEFSYYTDTKSNIETTVYSDDLNTEKHKQKKIILSINEIDKFLVLKSLSSNNFFNFSNLLKYFPNLRSINDFIEHKNYLGSSIINIYISENDDINNFIIYEALKNYLYKISIEIFENFGDFQGTKKFFRIPINKIFKDKILITKDIDKLTNTSNDYLNEDWYAYEENYGTSEEKSLVNLIFDLKDKIKEKYKSFYLIRNERFFKIFRFSDGRAFEPDYVMFLDNEEKVNVLSFQLFIEPKGEPFMKMDEWKQDFLLSINDNASIENQYLDTKLIGLPFYNESITKEEFLKSLSTSIGLN